MEEMRELLQKKCGVENYSKLTALDNPAVIEFIARFVAHCNPDSVFIRSDSDEDMESIRASAVKLGEEKQLVTEGHTVHFDGINDQGRDKNATRFFMVKGVEFGSHIHAIDRDEGREEIMGLLKDSMKGKQAYVLFFCLGPVNSEFSVFSVQITDSSYVAHSEDILYRPGYEALKNAPADTTFFKFVHSAGELENNVSKNVDKRRVYISLADNIVYSVNTQYAGNTIGLKKLALRLAINKADKEGWLVEHMFVMGVNGFGGRRTYFTGAFPSACGKTSTCMVQGENIVGDDIAYLRKRDGKIHAVNVERGIFGIIKDVNPADDPLIWEVLNSPGEVILSNVLVKEGKAYWQGDGREIPDSGVNFSGEWTKDKKDSQGNPILHSHGNARYTIRLRNLKNCDDRLDDKNGVPVSGVIYGGRDSRTWPPVFQSFNWIHGVITIASALESETTAATLGKEGVRKFNLMANLDFLSIPIGKYIQNHLEFVRGLEQPPLIFGVNYFIRGRSGEYLTGMHDKCVWLKWMELRIHEEASATKAPIGWLPCYETLKRLFKEVLDREYSRAQYNEQFAIRVKDNLEKIERIFEIYQTNVIGVPEVLFTLLAEQRERLEKAGELYGDVIVPGNFE